MRLLSPEHPHRRSQSRGPVGAVLFAVRQALHVICPPAPTPPPPAGPELQPHHLHGLRPRPGEAQQPHAGAVPLLPPNHIQLQGTTAVTNALPECHVARGTAADVEVPCLLPTTVHLTCSTYEPKSRDKGHGGICLTTAYRRKLRRSFTIGQRPAPRDVAWWYTGRAFGPGGRQGRKTMFWTWP